MIVILPTYIVALFLMLPGEEEDISGQNSTTKQVESRPTRGSFLLYSHGVEGKGNSATKYGLHRLSRSTMAEVAEPWPHVSGTKKTI